MSDNSKKLFKSFILDIVKVFPEYEKRLLKKYSKVLSEEDNCEELLSSFYENVEDIAKDLSENNFSIFENDPIILDNVSFKLIWNSNISNETKNNIWRYLQTFCVYNINNKQGKEDVEDVLNSIKQKEKVSDKGTLTNMKLLKKLSESLNSNIVMELLSNNGVKDKKEDNVKTVKMNDKNTEGLKGLEGGLKGMEDMLENSNIGKIAKEVSEELDIESMIKGGDGIESLMNGENMMNIFKSISEKIDNEDGNIMEEALDLSKNMKDNPLFSSLMSTMGQGLSQMGGNPAGMVPRDTPKHPDNRMINLNSNSNSHDGNATRKRLQKKLQEKNEGKIDVNKKD
tara:strand:- start:25 stop:1047 length:1023 start_codon:yes stop_codon:yes gene_type:complete